MPTLTTHANPPTAAASTLLVALDLGNTSWCLACAPAIAQAPRIRSFPARAVARLVTELVSARRHFGLAPNAPVVLCYEAGRDGFWLQRACTTAGITALVVDSSSIEVSRRARRAKTDRLDATALLRLLVRHVAGERGHWRVLHVPSVDEEDRRHPHRELGRLTRERTRAVNQIRGLLAAHGIVLPSLRHLPDQVAQLTQWDGQPLPAGACGRLLTTWARLTLVQQQRRALVKARRVQLEQSADPAVAMVRQLLRLRGGGEVSAWLFTMELFSWRRFRNRREVAGVLGLTATPSMSGARRRELGIGQGRIGGVARRGDGIGLGLVALSAGQRAESVVSAALCDRGIASAPDRDRRGGAPVDHRSLALRRNGASTRGRDVEGLTRRPHARAKERWHCTRRRSGSGISDRRFRRGRAAAR